MAGPADRPGPLTPSADRAVSIDRVDCASAALPDNPGTAAPGLPVDAS
jgi:hypothetical protein